MQLALTSVLDAGSREAADSRLWSVLSYRVSRRRQLALAEAVLEQLVPAQPGS